MLAVSFASAQQETPDLRSTTLIFSHRFHLTEAGATCLDCHTGTASSEAATDNNLPSEETCLSCHDGSKAGKECRICHQDPERAKPFSPHSRTLRFNHKFHLQFGNLAPVFASAIDGGRYLGPTAAVRPRLTTTNACQACHRALTETDFSSPHNLPQMADCLVCHTQIDPPFSCEFCHTAEAEIKPFSHTDDYIDLHSSGDFLHEKESCTICHGRNFRCMGCH